MEHDNTPAQSNASAFDENDDSDGWDEMETTSEQTTCLFCSSQFLTIAVAMDHCRTEHNFDLLDLKTKFHMDVYSYIKLINYIRQQKPTPKEILDCDQAPWLDDEYLKPGETESWLMYDFDDLGSAPSTPHYAIDGKTPISTITYSDLQRQIQDLTIQLKEKDILLKSAIEDINRMKKVTQNIVESGDTKTMPNCVAAIPVSYDSEYFNTYAHFGIHHEMLSDTVRTESYRDAILKNSNTFKDKTVLDVGCGTSILSMFAASAGAQKVYGIDQSDIVYKAMDIIRENELEQQVNLLHGRLEDTNLPENKFDLIISEWMGYFLLFEGMLDSVIYARDNHLKEGGKLLPNRCTLHLTACSNKERYDDLINFWDNVYGYNMSCMKSEVITEAIIETIPSDTIVSNSSLLTDIDLYTCTTSAPDFTSNFTLDITKDAEITCLVGYFDTFFELDVPISFSTGPNATKTHWQQTVFYLRSTIKAKKGDTISGTLCCNRKVKNVRGLTVIITIGEEKYKYNVD